MSRTIIVRLAVVAGLVLAVLLPGAAAQATAYRYWGYFSLQGDTWKFATKGPGQASPADGSIEGWRYAVGTTGDTRTPRAKPTFQQICAHTKATSGTKRVAVVIDYGRPADYARPDAKPAEPVGACAQVAAAATGMEVLGAVADVRQKGGLVCAVDGSPSSGCGDAVKSVSAAAKAPDTPVKLAIEGVGDKAKGQSDAGAGSATGTEIGIGIVVLALLGLGGALLLRRRNAG